MTKKLSNNECKVLLGMWSEHSSIYDEVANNSDGASFFFTFKAIQRQSGIEQRLVRRTVRALARKGLTAYAKGLSTEDGDFIGAGYGLTRAGRELAAQTPWKD